LWLVDGRTRVGGNWQWGMSLDLKFDKNGVRGTGEPAIRQWVHMTTADSYAGLSQVSPLQNPVGFPGLTQMTADLPEPKPKLNWVGPGWAEIPSKAA
jgi:hypothetical protein